MTYRLELVSYNNWIRNENNPQLFKQKIFQVKFKSSFEYFNDL